MPLKVHVLASNRERDQATPQSTFYRAEAYDDDDPFREPVWRCDHDHDSVEAAFECATGWLAEHGEEAPSA